MTFWRWIRESAIWPLPWAVWLRGVIAQAVAGRRSPWPTSGTLEGPVGIEPLGIGDVTSAVELVTRVLRVKPGDRGEQFASDINNDSRQMFVVKANGQVIAYGRVAGLAADEAGPRTPLASTTPVC